MTKTKICIGCEKEKDRKEFKGFSSFCKQCYDYCPKCGKKKGWLERNMAIAPKERKLLCDECYKEGKGRVRKAFKKLLLIYWEDEMKEGKPVVVATIDALGPSSLTKAIEKADKLGYEVQSITSTDSFLSIPKNTVIFRKKA